MNFRRVILIVLDGVGVGELPDAALFHDQGAHTLLHVAEQAKKLCLPNLQRLGLGNIVELPGVAPVDKPIAAWGKMLSHLPDQEDELLKILVHLERLRRITEAEFPDARTFVRAGFDKNDTSNF